MHDLKNKLNKLKKIEPSQEWKNKQWDLLMDKIDTKEAHAFTNWESMGFIFQHPSLLRPAMNLAVIVLVFVVGSWAALATVTNSMPGNLFYPTKVALEKVEVALTVNDNTKVTKQTDIARRRVGELQYIVAVNKLPIDSIHVDKTVKNINLNLQGAHDDLNRLSKEGGNGDFTKTAEEVAESVIKISKSLQEARQKLPAEVQVSVNDQIEETVNKVKNISAQAFELVIKQWLVDDNITEEQVVRKINEKVVELENKFASINLEKWTAEQAEEDELLALSQELNNTIEEAFAKIELDLVEKDYIGTLSLINNIRQDMGDLEKIINNEYVIEEVKGEEEVAEEVVEEDIKEEQEVKIEVIEN